MNIYIYPVIGDMEPGASGYPYDVDKNPFWVNYYFLNGVNVPGIPHHPTKFSAQIATINLLIDKPVYRVKVTLKK